MENNEKHIQSHTIQNKHNFFLWEILTRENLARRIGYFASFSLVNDVSVKEKGLFMELLDTCGILGYYRTLTHSVMLSISYSYFLYSTMDQDIIVHNGTSTPTGALVFNIVWHPTRGQFWLLQLSTSVANFTLIESYSYFTPR